MVDTLSFVVFALASFRLTRLIVFDTITAPFRRLFHEEQEEVNEQGEIETYIIIKGKGLRSWVGELLSCYWCTGMWCTAALLGIYILFPVVSMWLQLLLAIAAAAGIIEAFVSRLVK
ncbi:Sporulation protein YjcA [Bacillus pumilus]|nr:Sporulation protein YjcA [Bacillus pumilus]